MSWEVIGNFNEAMWGFEHFFETPHSNGQMIDFCDVLELCGLGDLGFSDLPHTCDKRRSRRGKSQSLARPGGGKQPFA